MRALLVALASALGVTLLVAPVHDVTLCTQACASIYQTPLGYPVPWGVAGWAIPLAVAAVAYWLTRVSARQRR